MTRLMTPWQLGMQANAAMYSNAIYWMQAFDCCCKDWHSLFVPFLMMTANSLNGLLAPNDFSVTTLTD